MSLMKYAVVLERGESTWGAYIPDLPGCIAVGESRSEVLTSIREAVGLHLGSLRRDGQRVPPAVSEVEYVEATLA